MKEELLLKKRRRRPEKKRKEESFSVKYQTENISSFVGYTNSLTTTLFCWVRQKQLKAIYKQKQGSVFQQNSISKTISGPDFTHNP